MNFKSIFLSIFGNPNLHNSNSSVGMEVAFTDNDGENIAKSTNLQNTNELSKKLKQTILAKVKVNKMTNLGYFRFYNIFLILATLVLSSFSIFLLAGFLADLNEINAISDDFWINFWQNSFLEFVLLATFLGILIYVIYRQTDWILVRHKRILIAGILIFITIFGIFGSFFIKKHLETLQNVENLSYRRNRTTNLGQKMKEKNIFIGKITEINKSQNWLKIANKLDTKTFYWQNENPTEILNQDLKENVDQRNWNQNSDQKLSEKISENTNNSENTKRKLRKNQYKLPKRSSENWNKNLKKKIDKLETGERVLLYFEIIEDKLEDKTVIIDLRIL